jgi:hypothetical protein
MSPEKEEFPDPTTVCGRMIDDVKLLKRFYRDRKPSDPIVSHLQYLGRSVGSLGDLMIDDFEASRRPKLKVVRP